MKAPLAGVCVHSAHSLEPRLGGCRQYLEGSRNREAHEAGAEVGLAQHRAQGGHEHQPVPHQLQVGSEPPAKGQVRVGSVGASVGPASLGTRAVPARVPTGSRLRSPPHPGLTQARRVGEAQAAPARLRPAQDPAHSRCPSKLCFLSLGYGEPHPLCSPCLNPTSIFT